MDQQDLIALLNRLRREPTETEWLELKANYYEAQEIGEYLSALANSACLLGKPKGYLVFGLEDTIHNVVGTSFNPCKKKGKGQQELLLWLSLNLQPRIGFECYLIPVEGKCVVLFRGIAGIWSASKI